MSSAEIDQSSSALASPCLGSFALSSLFDHLSDDLLCITFRLLSQQTPSSLNHALVCKRWRRLVYLSQASISMRSSRDNAIQADTDLLKYLSKFTKLTSPTINSCSFDDGCEFLFGLGSACPRLTRLGLRNLYDRGALVWDGLDAVFTACTGLQHLALDVVASPAALPPSFFDLSSLTEVNLQVDFLSLPDEFSKLRCLKKLTSTYLFCDLPESFGLLTRLTELQMSHCNLVYHLPESFGSLRSLVKLTLSNIVHLKDLPDSIGCLQNLQECLLIGSSSLSELPDSFFLLTSLRVLELTKFSEVQRFPSAMSDLVSLKSLTIRNCSALRELPERMDRMSSLEHLELRQLSSLTQLPDSLSSLSNIRTFSFNHCNSVTSIPSSLLRNWRTSLTSLEFGWPTSCPTGDVGNETCFLTDFISSVCELENLSALLLYGIPRLAFFPNEGHDLQRLQRLTMCSCPDLLSLYRIYSNGNLRTLEIIACPNFQDETDEIFFQISTLESARIDGRSLGRGGIRGAG